MFCLQSSYMFKIVDFIYSWWILIAWLSIKCLYYFPLIRCRYYLWSLLFKKILKLKYSCFTLLGQFLRYSKVNQLCICLVLLSIHVLLFVTLWTLVCQIPLSMGILQVRILEWVAMPSSRDLPSPGFEPRSPALQVDSLPSEPTGKPESTINICTSPPFRDFRPI